MSKPVDPANIAKVPTEHAQQVAVFVWAALNFPKYPELRMMFAIPNGGERNKIVAANLKAEGVRAGVPDIFLPVPRGKWHGLFIEMKKEGGPTNPRQKEFIKALQMQGYGACVCVGWLAATEALVGYLEWR
jgi:hypothetical protein